MLSLATHTALALHLAIAPAPQDGPPPGVREAMWPAPSQEDWARPCLIRWERSWDDAIAVSRESGRPILICVNMDGEIASEHYAGIRYREPEKAALYEPYICVIASVYRHTPRDFDEKGGRIPCPRFGTVTCGEHISIEPVLFDQYFEDTRVAPRHIMVELDGAETYDVYYAFDTDSVFRAIREGIDEREGEPRLVLRGDRPIEELVGSRHSADREAVEVTYLRGSSEQRRKLLLRAVELGADPPLDLLRLAIFGFDMELSQVARQALAQANSAGAVDLINEALRVPMDEAGREGLIKALERIGEGDARARTLAVVHRGLTKPSETVDVEDWSRSLQAAAPAQQRQWKTIAAQIEYRAEASRARPEDPDAQLELAESWLALAVNPETAVALAADPKTSTRYSRFLFEDSRRAALKALDLGGAGWRLDAVLALTSYYLGEVEDAYARAEQAVTSLPPGAEGWNAVAVLGLFAQGRREAIARKARAREQWPGEWMTDVHAAYSVIARHPLGTDLHVVSHHDFLKDLQAAGQAARVLEEGLARFPDSAMLHDRLRAQILADRGVAGLEPAYEAMLEGERASPNLTWHAGYTALVAAEFHRREGRPADAVAAYGRGMAHFEGYIEASPAARDSADHFVALALAAKARLALEEGDLEPALAGILACFERRADAAASFDGLGISPVGTAKMLRARLVDAERAAMVATLDAAMAELDPDLLRLPAFERGGPSWRDRLRDRLRGRNGPERDGR